MITHGWPGSVVELLDAIGPLTDPTAHGGDAADAFHLVLPSLPGYGFSGQPAEVGWPTGRAARAWAELMKRLGYTRYVAQGGDQGAAVTDDLARLAPDGLAGIHLNLLEDGARLDRRPADRDRRGAGGARRPRHVPPDRFRLLPRAVDAPADDRLRAARLAGRAGGLDDRPRHRQLLQDRRRLRGGEADRQPDARQRARQRHALLADGNGRVGGAGRTGRTAEPRRSPPARRRRRSRSRSGSRSSPARSSGRRAAGPRRRTRRSTYFNKAERGGHFAAWEEPQIFTDELRAAFGTLR